MCDKPGGKCDICKENPAKYWYGNTAAKICGSSLCEETMDERYEEHYRAVVQAVALDKLIQEAYNYD